MAITSSAKKAIRNAGRKRVFNLRRKKKVTEIVKNIRKLVGAKKMAEAAALLPAAYKAIDKAAKSNFLHKNAAARRKSRIAALVNGTNE